MFHLSETASVFEGKHYQQYFQIILLFHFKIKNLNFMILF